MFQTFFLLIRVGGEVGGVDPVLVFSGSRSRVLVAAPALGQPIGGILFHLSVFRRLTEAWVGSHGAGLLGPEHHRILRVVSVLCEH